MIERLIEIPVAFWTVLGQMAPWLLFGFLAAGLLSVLVSPEWVERHLGGRGAWPVAKATLFGIPLPLCSCGVIPVTATLRRHGAGRGASTAFLIATPQTGVDSILVTGSLMGWAFAGFRVVAALVSGLIGGAAVEATGDRPAGGDNGVGACEEACCSGEARGGPIRRVMHYGFVTLPRDLAKSLLVGLLIAAAITALLPPNVIPEQLTRGPAAMLVMLALGVPIYVCATASVPIAAALLFKGVSPGAALVFLMTGPATNAATIAIVWKLLGRRTAVVYLLVVAATALAAGAACDALLGGTVAGLQEEGHAMAGAWFNHAAAVVLLGVLGWAMLSSRRSPSVAVPEAPADEGVRLRVRGMTCSHCARTVERALAEQPGVEAAEVDLAGGRAVARGARLDAASLCRIVESVGYRAEPI